MNPPLIAYHGQQTIKDKYVARMQAHMAADQLIRGQGWIPDDQEGCAVGCTLDQYNHIAYETELGISRIIARLEDNIFEGMPQADAMLFPLAFLEAIQPGTDLSLVWPRFAVWMLTDETHGVRQYASEKGAAAIDTVAALYRRVIAGETVERAEWRTAAAYAAYVADADAAYAYAYAADAADAADAYAYAYAADAADAADAYAYAYAADAARRAWWLAARDELLRLLAAAPIAAEAVPDV